MLSILQAGVPGGPELLILFFIGLLLVVPLAVAFFVYRDAKRRNSRHALAWGIGAFLGGVIVWILYFVVRDEVGSSGTTASV
ncbi:hypothetical protein E6P09_14275 [Haloferax mediterranei ATCC 33500]|uniref:Cardiolipin synthase N-terminal domain-containing protein n=1 Tax=Haloferax mediterranei (strain ATCC 33500 / DSM 1411 / JCM 8866 / NBRC 14739 / NCIMB 2177 / R-4) TaxID=523841 RepID=M0IVA3_HALMT|nr:hypothetical protein [Haloferax mediterranei]AHZ23558.1 hypothetical protein BM92_13310 [Haloferax mediterranei ATCC 33500]ELZ99733.1 hypothetical protein C439_14304 [Haloferax mediterranei ATCC 33500]MDX5987064.1 hypothetical protein [Haloferax mediterranei ATCC 33500]QCQ76380.1 hypothetical protein E6P09_14275 [Haloferax mediterranei ATCC 33500]